MSISLSASVSVSLSLPQSLRAHNSGAQVILLPKEQGLQVHTAAFLSCQSCLTLLSVFLTLVSSLSVPFSLCLSPPSLPISSRPSPLLCGTPLLECLPRHLQVVVPLGLREAVEVHEARVQPLVVIPNLEKPCAQLLGLPALPIPPRL